MGFLNNKISCFPNRNTSSCNSAKIALATGKAFSLIGAVMVIIGTSLFLGEVVNEKPKASHLWTSDGLSIGGATLIVIGSFLQHFGLSKLTIACTNGIDTSGNTTHIKNAPRFTSQQLRWVATINVLLAAVSYGVPYYIQDKAFIDNIHKTKTAISPLTIASYPLTLLFLVAYIICFRQAVKSKIYEAENQIPLNSGYQHLESGTPDIHPDDTQSYDSDTSPLPTERENRLSIRTISTDTTDTTKQKIDLLQELDAEKTTTAIFDEQSETKQDINYGSSDSDSDSSIFGYN
ncbi:MAG: hypothetical protein P1U34_01925 [Coxiellaceae bacterium]|nr:hypothetical protein [Coxiellaceae bacterium]